MVPREQDAREALKVSELARASGVTKELIHHYLREGLLPRPARPALYGDHHLRLLRAIKALRDERFLPLPVIRELVVLADHDPARLEIVLRSGSEMVATAAQLAASNGGPDERLGREELEPRSGAPRELVERCLAVGLIRAGADGFLRQDANVLALVHQGTALGIPLDSFRTIRSYVEVSFELERALFMPGPREDADLGRLAREIAVRKELANAFVANVLNALIGHELSGLLAPTSARARAVAASFYRPSDAFLRKHGVLDALDVLRERLRARPRDAAPQRQLLRLQAVAGRWRELVFTVEQARGALARDPLTRRLHGRALLMVGETERSLEVLAGISAERPDDVVAAAYLAAARFGRDGGGARVEVALPAIEQAIGQAEAALGAADDAGPEEATEVRLACGWLLSSLPAGSTRIARGVRELQAAHRACAADDDQGGVEHAARLRQRITAAGLLHQALGREALPARLAAGAPARREALLAEVLRLDPASELALELYQRGGT